MTDLDNNFPSWGETGEFPADGFFYEGGDQVNEKHMDSLWNGINVQFDEFVTGIENRVLDGPYGNYVTDNGLVASQGGGTREVDVTTTSLAYVGGQRVTSVSAQTVTLSDTGGGTRTDVVYLQEDGSVAKSEGTTSAPAGTLKIAEVDLDSGGSITTIRNYTRDRTQIFASETSPGSPSTNSGLWHDKTASRYKIYQNGSFRPLLTGDGNVPLTGSLDVNANDLVDVGAVSLNDEDGDGNTWSILENAANGRLNMDDDTSTRFSLAENGDLSIEGALTEGDAL